MNKKKILLSYNGVHFLQFILFSFSSAHSYQNLGTVTPDVHCIAAHGAAMLRVAFLFVSMLTHVT